MMLLIVQFAPSSYYYKSALFQSSSTCF